MTTKTKGRKARAKDAPERTIDPYTGEVRPVPEDAEEFVEIVPTETGDRDGSSYLLHEETSMDNYTADADSNAPADQAAHFTEDPEIEAHFARRQQLGASGRDVLQEELEQHNALSPEISGGDLDASWQTGNQAGEETVGGSSPTPDQDVVDELGEAAGLVYGDAEPLDYDAKVLARDRNRWELNPASTLQDDGERPGDEEEDDELEELDDLDEDEDEDLEDVDLDEEELEDDEWEDEDDELIDAEVEDDEKES